jgi:hypothetical protein
VELTLGSIVSDFRGALSDCKVGGVFTVGDALPSQPCGAGFGEGT